MKFESKRLFIRDFKPNEYHLFASVFSNEKVMKYAYMDKIENECEMHSFFNESLNNNKGMRTTYMLAVFLCDKKTFIGVAEIFIHFHFTRIKDGEIGYFLLPEYWGCGYATEMAESLIDFCFLKLKLKKTVASCNYRNHASENIMKKLGMIKEAELRKERYKNGSWDNELRYGLLLEEYNKRKPET